MSAAQTQCAFGPASDINDAGDFDREPMHCVDCDAVVIESHSKQGFGHYRRCCACYERRQRGPVKP